MASSKKCRHFSKTTTCDDCAEYLPPKFSTDRLAVSAMDELRALRNDVRALDAKLDTSARAKTSAKATKKVEAERLIDARAAGRIVGRSAAWCREHYLELGGRPIGDGSRPRKMFLRSAVIAYARGPGA